MSPAAMAFPQRPSGATVALDGVLVAASNSMSRGLQATEGLAIPTTKAAVDEIVKMNMKNCYKSH